MDTRDDGYPDVVSTLHSAYEQALLIERLRTVDTRGRGFRGDGRSGVLSDHDVWVEERIARCEGWVDTEAMQVMWQVGNQA